VVALHAYRQGIAIGDFALADRAERVLVRSDGAPLDAALVRFALSLKAGDRVTAAAALGRLKDGPLDFLRPVLGAWLALDSGGDPLALLGSGADSAVARRYNGESRVLLLIALRRSDEALELLRPMLRGAPGEDMRINAALMLALTGERGAAKSLVDGDRPEMTRLRRQLGKGPKPNAATGAARVFLSLAVDLSQDPNPSPITIVLTRAALLLDPSDDRARLYLGEALSRSAMDRLALDVLGQVRRDSPFARGAAAGRIEALRRAGRMAEAIALAKTQAGDRESTGADVQIYADLLAADGQFAAAAAAYGAAIARPGGAGDWTLHFRRGKALDSAGRWGEALPSLRRAAELAPREAEALKTLATAQVEHGVDLEQAMLLLERAVLLKPGDATITDALAWALYRRGEVARALPLLERAAADDPGGSLINEHLGDAYWRLGRRYEARYAWRAAAIYADAGAATRIQAKLANGLTASN
jgi:tetratricopeptide (TPR) repeat protein